MSRSLLRAALTVAFTLALLVGVAVLGQVPFGRASGEAVLRVSLRTVHGNAEICRDLSAEEIEALAQHMRQPRACEEIAPPYLLTVRVDDRTVIDERIRPGGLRGDRPLIVDRQVALEPGPARLSVGFAPVLDKAAQEALTEALVELPSFSLDTEVNLVADRITLVTVTGARQLGIYEDERLSPGS